MLLCSMKLMAWMALRGHYFVLSGFCETPRTDLIGLVLPDPMVVITLQVPATAGLSSAALRSQLLLRVT